MINLLYYSDILLFPLYTVIFYYVYKRIVFRLCSDPDEIRVLIKAFWAKIIFTFLYAFVLQVIYGGGDSSRFYGTIQDLRLASSTNINFVYEILVSPAIVKETPLAYFIENGIFEGDNIGYMQMSSNFLIPKIGFFLSYICFNSYLCISLFFSIFALAGCVGLYKTFKVYYPSLKREISWITLFLPSVLFWVSALSKESICFGALGILFYLLMRMVRLGKISFGHIAIVVLCCSLILTVKNYIMIAMLPGLLILFFFSLVSKIKSNLVKYITNIFTAIIVISLIVYIFDNLDILVGSDSERFKKDAMLEYTSQQIGRYEQQGGSTIVITENQFDGTMGSFVRMFPTALFNAYYRPLLWEINNPAMLFSGLECFACLLLTLYALGISRVIGFFKILFTDLFALQCFIFTIFLGGIVGMTTFNLGTLVRYKTPALPFFLLLLFIIIDKYRKQKPNTPAEV